MGFVTAPGPARLGSLTLKVPAGAKHDNASNEKKHRAECDEEDNRASASAEISSPQHTTLL